MSDILRGTITDRFASSSTPLSDHMGLRVSQPGAVDWQERDAAISRAIGKGEGSLAGWMNGVEKKIEAAKLFIANNNVPAAMAIDDEIQKVTNANADSILRYSNLTGVQPGSLAERMRGIAQVLRNGTYANDKVTFGGKEYTYGTLLRSEEGRAAVNQSTSDSLYSLGFDRSVSSMMLSGTAEQLGADTIKSAGDNAQNFVASSDATAKACMKFLTDNDTKMMAVNRGIIPNDESRVIRSGMANELAANWKNYFLTFGSSTESFVSRAYDMFKDSGGHRMMPAIRDYAVRVASKNPGLEGKALVEETFRQLEDWRTAVTKTNRRTAPGQRVDPDDVGLNEQNAALAGAISALSRTDADFDLRDPAARTRASELGDLVAKMKVSGVNLMREARRNGVDINGDMAMHILGTGTPGSSIENVKAFYEDQKRYTGGVDFATGLYGATHSASDYWSSLSRQNGGQSSCPGADALLTGLTRARARCILPEMFKRGVSHKDAMTIIRTDRDLAQKYATSMADAFAAALPGVGARDAAASLVSYMFDHEADAAGGAVNVQRLIQDASEGKIDGLKLSPQAKDSLRGWVSANVSDAAAFGSLPDQMRQKLTGLKVDPYYAAMLTSQASARASFLKSQGGDWTRPFTTFLDDLTYVPRQIVDDNGKLARTVMVLDHANRYNGDVVVRGQKYKVRPGNYNSNPAALEALWSAARTEGMEIDQLRMIAARQKAKDEPDQYTEQ